MAVAVAMLSVQTRNLWISNKGKIVGRIPAEPDGRALQLPFFAVRQHNARHVEDLMAELLLKPRFGGLLDGPSRFSTFPRAIEGGGF